MKVTTIKYSKHFHPTNPGEWIGLEGALEEGEDILSAFAQARKITQEAHEQGFQVKVTVTKEEKLTGDLAMDIASCKDLHTLDSYRLIVRGKPELEAAFKKRAVELGRNED